MVSPAKMIFRAHLTLAISCFWALSSWAQTVPPPTQTAASASVASTALASSQADPTLSILMKERIVLENAIASQNRNEVLARNALAAGQQALTDARSEGNAQAQTIAQHAIDVAKQVINRAQQLLIADQQQIQSLDQAIARQKQVSESQSGMRRKSICSRIAVLGNELAGLDESLAHLNQSARTNASERAEWVALSNRAAADAWRRGADMAMDGLSDYALRQLNEGLHDVDENLGKAAVELSGETDHNRREQLGSALRLLKSEKRSLRQAVRVVQGGAHARREIETTVDSLRWAAAAPQDLQDTAQQAFQTGSDLLNSPELQEALHMSVFPGQVAKYGAAIVNSGYDIATETVSVKQLDALNVESGQYAIAVKSLQKRIRNTVDGMESLKKELQSNSGTPGSAGTGVCGP